MKGDDFIKDRHEEFQDVVIPSEVNQKEHSLICNEDLFYAELRAAAEDTEKDTDESE